MYSFRKIEKDDIFKIKKMRNEQMEVLRQSTPLTDEDQEKWYQKVILPSYKEKTKTLNFTILFDNEFIGYGGLVNIDYVNKKAEVSFLVEISRTMDKNVYEHDFSNFLNFISDYSMNELQLHRIWTETYEFRNFHISILEKNGFKREGVMKDSVINNGKYISSIFHGKILNNYKEEKKELVDYKNYFRNKVVFVTGGAGLIGSDLIINLSKLDIKRLICVDLKDKPNKFNDIDMEYIKGDVNDLDVEYVKGFDPNIIFHLAATFERTTESMEFWEESFNNNVRLSNHIGTICKNLKNLERVIFTSSYLIYNSDLYTFYEPQTNPVIITEDTPIYPRNICGAAKLLHEIELNFFSHFEDIKFTSITPRIFRVYGPGECGRLGGTIINRWINSLLDEEEKPLTVFAKEGIFDYIYSEDIAFGLILLAASEHKGVINLGKGDGRRIMDVLSILGEYFPKMKYNEIKAEIKYEACQSDMELFNKVTGWIPKTNLEEGIKKCVENIRMNRLL